MKEPTGPPAPFATLPVGGVSLNPMAMIGRPVFLLAMVLAAPLAQAAGLSSHSVSYEVKLPAEPDKNSYAEGQGTYSLTRSCQGWTLGEVYQFGIEKGTSG